MTANSSSNCIIGERNLCTPNGKIAALLIDMDGTLCDYQGALTRDLEALRGPNDPRIAADDDTPAWLRARENVVRRQPGWWRGLPRLHLGF